MARDVTSGFADFGQLELSAEPRASWNNDQVNARRQVNQDPWYGFYRTISSVNDVIAAVNGGLVIVDPVRTARAKAMGKFMQGLSYGYLGLMFDKAVITDERTQLDTITTPNFVPYATVITTAISQLDSAAAVANSQPTMTFPVDGWLYQSLTKDQFVRLTNSYAARLLAYSPRTRTERGRGELGRGGAAHRRRHHHRLRTRWRSRTSWWMTGSASWPACAPRDVRRTTRARATG